MIKITEMSIGSVPTPKLTKLQMDVLFAEKVLGCKVESEDGEYGHCCCEGNPHGSDRHDTLIPEYTASIEHALQGWEHMSGNGCIGVLSCYGKGSYEFALNFRRKCVIGPREKTPAMAIVVTCLVAVGVAV